MALTTQRTSTALSLVLCTALTLTQTITVTADDALARGWGDNIDWQTLDDAKQIAGCNIVWLGLVPCVTSFDSERYVLGHQSGSVAHVFPFE